MANSKTIKFIAKGWITKGDNEINPFNKFICYWISFNCFYSVKTGIRNDTNALEALCKDYSITQSYKSIICSSNIALFDNLKSICPIERVGTAKLKSISSVLNFKQVISVLYLIRCNLFHGDKGESAKRDLLVVRAANPVLELIVKKLVSIHL